MDDSPNPYAAPAYVETLPAARLEETAAEHIRRTHLGHEASIQSWGGLCIIAGAGGAAILLLGILVALASWAQQGPSAAAIIGNVVGAIICGAVCMALMTTGWGLRRLDPKCRGTAMVLSVLGLFAFPCGTLVNLYVLYLLSSQKGQTVFTETYAEIRRQTPHIRYGMPRWNWIVVGLFALGIAAVLAWRMIVVGL